MQVWDLINDVLIAPLAGHDGKVLAVACTELDGRAVAVTAGEDRTVRVWDLTTGTEVRSPISGHDGTVHAVTCTELNGRTVAITGCADGKTRVWDLTNRRSTGSPLTGHSAAVRALAYGTVGGHDVAVTGGDDQTVRVWDLASGQPIGEPMIGPINEINELACALIGSHVIAVTPGVGAMCIFDVAPRRKRMASRMLTGRSISALACTRLNYRSVAVTVYIDGMLQVWDLADRHVIGTLRNPEFKWKATSVACAMLKDRPVAVTPCDDFKVWVWDLTSGQPIGEPMTGHTGPIHAVACGTLNDRAVAVTVGHDQKVWVWDLAAGETICQLMTSHIGPIHTVACGTIYGRSLAATGGADSVLRVWDLATDSQCEKFVFPNAINDVLITADGDLLVSFGWEVAYLRGILQNGGSQMTELRLLGVHGVRNLQPGLDPSAAAQRLANWWIDALLKGRTFDRSSLVLDVAYYAHRLSHSIPQGDYGLDQLDPLIEYEILNWAKLLGAPDETVQGRVSMPARAAVDWIARKFGLDQRIVRTFVAIFFNEVHTYFANPDRRKAAITDVAHAIEHTQPRAVIGHSLGSVVSYEALWTQPHPDIDLLLTLGSPLAMPDIVYPQLRAQRGNPARPPGVARWINISDPGDIVAIPIGGIAHSFEGVTADLIDAINTFDFHRVTNYLSCGATTGVLTAYL
jgi:WD40 repeat protein